MKNLKLHALASLLVVAQTAHAQQHRNIPVPASSAGGGGVAAVAITPDDVRGMAGAGATVLPHRLPPGSYRNAAPYPLMLAAVVYNRQDGSIIINGQRVASNRVRDTGTWATMTGVVPAGALFTLNSVEHASVTAMANGATWQQTGIRFAVDGGVYVTTPVDDAPVFQNVFNCRISTSAPFNGRAQDRPRNPPPPINAVLASGVECSRGRSVVILGTLGPSFVPSPNVNGERYNIRFNALSTSGVYPRNIRENAGVCRAELRQGDNWGTTSTTWSGQFAFPQVYSNGTDTQAFTRDACAPAVIANLRTTGLPFVTPLIENESSR